MHGSQKIYTILDLPVRYANANLSAKKIQLKECTADWIFSKPTNASARAQNLPSKQKKLFD